MRPTESNGIASHRSNSLQSISESTPTKRPMGAADRQIREPISDYFGILTFGTDKMREKLPAKSYNELVQTLENGRQLSPETTDDIAAAVRDWAVSHGATHYCHWFQPMTGLTAEKHDAFITIQYSNHSELKVIERFKGEQLIQGEPDASSFPNGGMRSTFEARGYTAWDPSSPLFLVEGESGTTLCIPSVFFGYHGEALDHKTPLLRSQQALSRSACDFLKLLGDVDTKSVIATLGTEQEYFLIDRRFASLRPDLIMAGRTLIGAPSARGQRLEDHYFGSIPGRVKSFMEDFEQELYKLGVPVKTRHNEVAPSQFEVAPIFEDANIAVDHNVLTMETMKRVAKRHGFVCLLHEKPFAEINGNGKHCNWSLQNSKGENLLDPGKTPHQNLRFLAVIAAVVRAVYLRSDLLRASIASAGNDHRLGGNEAPPAIISAFLGSLLEKIFDNVLKGEAQEATEAQIISLGASQIPDISRDYTDRNRTSPFAFTGNKFEFRAVGASANVAVPVTILNTAVAESLTLAAKRLSELLKESDSRDGAVMNLVREMVEEAKPVLFSGDNYSEQWRVEAQKRGLPILNTTPEALACMEKSDRVAFLIEQSVLNEAEIQSRYHVATERWVRTQEIELAILSQLVDEYVIPSVEKQLMRSHSVAQSLTLKSAAKPYSERVSELEETLESILTHQRDVKSALDKTSTLEEDSGKMGWLSNDVLPIAEKLRAAADKAELLIADELWALPKYREMLFANVIS